MQDFIKQTAQSCFYQLRRIGLVRKYLSTDAAAKLVTSLILSRLDYCNSLLSGLPASTTHPLQRIQNSAACLIPRKRKRDHITPMLRSLHGLPVADRIQYKINFLCHKCIHGSAPSYLCDCLHLYTPSRTLRSSSDAFILRTPRSNLSSVGTRSFSVAGPLHWNKLPPHLKHNSSIPSFELGLKTHLFSSL